MSRNRLLWHSNAPSAPTGYGVQTALFTPLLNKDYEVAISSFYGLEGAPVLWREIPLLPGLGGNFGQEYLPLHAERWGGGDASNCLVFTLMDVWVLPGDFMERVGGKLICWTPVDHDPAPPLVKAFFAESGAYPLAMSRFGQEQLAEYGAGYCPHGVDTTVYKERERAKEQDKFWWVGMCAANKGRPSRKGFQYAFEAFAEFHKRHEDARLYLHTSLQPDWMQGEDLIALQNACGIPQGAVAYADQYRLHFDPMKSEEMSHIFSAMSCLLNPCMGGGFEIAQLEAAACGVPSITTDFTAMPESAGPTPWKIKGTKFWTGQKSWNMEADVGSMVDALEECYAMSPKQRRALSKRMRRHALKYDAERVYKEHMLPSIKKAEKRLTKRGKGIDVTEGLKDEASVRELKPAEEGPTISVVVPWHEHPELAEDFWKALDGEKTHEVIVVDNGSKLPVKRAEIRLPENTGFCHANNVGLEKATGEAVLFLNNDIALGIPGWLETIRSELEPGVLVGANVRADQHTAVDGEVQPYLDGWCIAGMREDFEKLGGWDETYEEPAYYSDNDLCFRARQLGMTFAAVNPPLIHLLNRTAGPPGGEVTEVTRRNYKKFAEKVREAEKVAA